MTREAFIRKWLANPKNQYNEQCRDEMRDDLDLVIKFMKAVEDFRSQFTQQELDEMFKDLPNDR